MAPSFDPQTNLFYVTARRVYSIYYLTVTGRVEGWGGRDQNLWASSTIRALDYRTGKVVWNHETGDGRVGQEFLLPQGIFCSLLTLREICWRLIRRLARHCGISMLEAA